MRNYKWRGKKQPLFLKWLLVNCFADFK